jgi:hypothetical protein
MNWLAHARITSVSAPLAFGCGSHDHYSRTPNQWVLASDFPAAAAA